MAQDDLLSQEEIDALLNGPGGDDESPASKEPRLRPYDPASQHRVIRELSLIHISEPTRPY